MYFDRKCKITFVCHGATIYSEEGRFSDLENYPPLSESGVEEMDAMAKLIKKRGVNNDAIYTSPSVRTIQSAMIISKAFKKDYIVIDTLNPRNCGSWRGLTYRQIFEKHPEGFTKVLADKAASKKEGIESYPEFIKRIGKSIDSIVEQNIGNRIIVVTHPEVIQAAICSALNIQADKMDKMFIRTGSATQINYFENWSSLVYSDNVPL